MGEGGGGVHSPADCEIEAAEQKLDTSAQIRRYGFVVGGLFRHRNESDMALVIEGHAHFAYKHLF